MISFGDEVVNQFFDHTASAQAMRTAQHKKDASNQSKPAPAEVNSNTATMVQPEDDGQEPQDYYCQYYQIMGAFVFFHPVFHVCHCRPWCTMCLYDE
jgi:hypothetical protein